MFCIVDPILLHLAVCYSRSRDHCLSGTMVAASGWKQKGQKVKDIDPLLLSKYTINVDVSQGFGGLFGILVGNREKRLN